MQVITIKNSFFYAGNFTGIPYGFNHKFLITFLCDRSKILYGKYAVQHIIYRKELLGRVIGMNSLKDVNMITVIIAALFIFPLLAGALRPLSRQRIQYSFISVLDNVEFL